MGYGKPKTFLLLGLVLFGGSPRLPAQQDFYQHFRSRNAAMADVQPVWMGPLIQSDARLSQAVRVSVSDAHAPGAQVLSYGNNHGISVIGGNRFQFDLNPPSYFRNHSAALPDGFGNAFTQVKYRIASGNAEHGNFIVTAILGRAFGGGFAQNGMATGFYCPKIAAGKGFGRFDAQSSMNAVLPTGKIAEQGRVFEWNTTAQIHTTAHTWFDVENNTAYFFGGPADGNVQNFITPAGFYMIRRRAWEPTHAAIVFNAGMQIATSQFHLYDHNLITEMRILF
jgi:hypothetical protein